MAAVTSAILGAGVAAYGMSQQKKNVKKQNKQIAQANAAQTQAAAKNKEASEASVRAEQIRAQQMELEGLRRRRDIIRQAQGARSLGLARANSQGAMMSSSAIAGQQQAASQSRVDVLANNQNIQLGRALFKENENIYKAQAEGAQIQTQANNYLSMAQTYANRGQIGAQLFGLGGQIVGASSTIGNVAQTAYSQGLSLFQPQSTTVNFGGGF